MDRLPPERPWAPCSIPLPGGCSVHFRRHVIVLGNLLLNSQLLVALILLLAADVGNACFLVFVNVKNSFSFHGRSFDCVRRERRIDLLLRRRLRRARAKASSRKQRGC